MEKAEQELENKYRGRYKNDEDDKEVRKLREKLKLIDEINGDDNYTSDFNEEPFIQLKKIT